MSLIPFPTNQGNGSSSRYRRENGFSCAMGRTSQCSLQVERGTLRNFLRCLQGVKDPFQVEEGRDIFSRCSYEKALISLEGISWFFSKGGSRKLWVTVDPQSGLQGPAQKGSGKSSQLHASCHGTRDSSPIA